MALEVVGLCGVAQSGKDTAASFLVKRGYTRLAFADILRESLYNLNPVIAYNTDYGIEQRVQNAVDVFGWDAVKVDYPEARELLQRMGTEVGRHLYGENFWVDRVHAQMEPDGKYVITDVRFPNEATFVRSLNGVLLRIERPGVGPVNNHASEATHLLEVDGTVVNDGSLESFEAQVVGFVTALPLLRWVNESVG